MAAEYEHIQQVMLFNWIEDNKPRWPELGMAHAIPNGGQRSKAVAGKLKAEGVKSGVPDICLPVPRGNYHGFYIELKAIYPNGKRGRASMEQLAWRDWLRTHGYKADIYWGWMAAADAIALYLTEGR